jgi:hypothetical protein
VCSAYVRNLSETKILKIRCICNLEDICEALRPSQFKLLAFCVPRLAYATDVDFCTLGLRVSIWDRKSRVWVKILILR